MGTAPGGDKLTPEEKANLFKAFRDQDQPDLEQQRMPLPKNKNDEILAKLD